MPGSSSDLLATLTIQWAFDVHIIVLARCGLEGKMAIEQVAVYVCNISVKR